MKTHLRMATMLSFLALPIGLFAQTDIVRITEANGDQNAQQNPWSMGMGGVSVVAPMQESYQSGLENPAIMATGEALAGAQIFLSQISIRDRSPLPHIIGVGYFHKIGKKNTLHYGLKYTGLGFNAGNVQHHRISYARMLNDQWEIGVSANLGITRFNDLISPDQTIVDSRNQNLSMDLGARYHQQWGQIGKETYEFQMGGSINSIGPAFNRRFFNDTDPDRFIRQYQSTRMNMGVLGRYENWIEPDMSIFLSFAAQIQKSLLPAWTEDDGIPTMPRLWGESFQADRSGRIALMVGPSFGISYRETYYELRLGVLRERYSILQDAFQTRVVLTGGLGIGWKDIKLDVSYNRFSSLFLGNFWNAGLSYALNEN
ncbi:hypothetical protein [Pontibacter sp. G13]|uniref:hypothetical protein n=1 Tax=Pontibacter sp. G13 TaxID=3074898 RepID=UPI0028896C81|nr:hypothetical protein [Pontibacter sp. G13]WNJ18333.1 hypothetical protein RJD25_26060 [Pontibacter sp. G13]